MTSQASRKRPARLLIGSDCESGNASNKPPWSSPRSAHWDAGKPISVRDTPEGLAGMLVRLDDTADRVDDAMAYFEYQTAIVVCTGEPLQPHRHRWGRKKSGWKRWRSSPGYQRKHYWRRGGRSHTAKEPVEEYRGVFWGYQSGSQKPSAETTIAHSAKPTTCKTVTQSWSMGIPHPQLPHSRWATASEPLGDRCARVPACGSPMPARQVCRSRSSRSLCLAPKPDATLSLVTHIRKGSDMLA